MNEALTAGGAAALGTLIPGLIAFFVLSKYFKSYIEDVVGKKPESPTTVMNQPLIVKDAVRHATYAELEQVRAESKQRHEEFEKRASEFRKTTEWKLSEIDKHVSSIPAQVIALLRDTKDLL